MTIHSQSRAATNHPGELIDDDDAPRDRVLVVEANGWHLAMPVSCVKEVHRDVRVTRVPGAPPIMFGVANLRGTIVTVLDLTVALEEAERDFLPSAFTGTHRTLARTRGVTPGSIVLLEHGGRPVGLRVEQVREVPTRDDGPLAPTTLTGADDDDRPTGAAVYVIGALRANGEEVAVLDIDALLERYMPIPKE